MNIIQDIQPIVSEEKILSDKNKDDHKKIYQEDDLTENNIAPTPTDLRISTITAVCKTNFSVDLQKLIENIDSVLVSSTSNTEGICKAVYGNICKGERLKASKKKKSKCFYNQITTIVLIKKDDIFKEINIKIFNNGNLQLTGLKKREEGIHSINILMEAIKNVHQQFGDILPEIDGDTIEFNNFDIVLINSDYSARFKIKRDKLHEILVNNYNLYASYEPCIYPGVNSKYYWNSDYKNYPNKGVCYCSSNCNGKGNGCGDGQCKKITISIFQSGNVIITGARTFEQIQASYIFINDVFKKNFTSIKRKNIPFSDNSSKISLKKGSSEKIILLKKCDIVFKNKKLFN